MMTIEKIKQLAKEIQSDENISDAEAMKLAIEFDRNQILAEAFGVINPNTGPRFLENIAMSMQIIAEK